MSSSANPKYQSNAFRIIIIWSGIIFFIAILFGLLYRVIYPVELYLNENEYIERVFVEAETRAWQHPEENSTIVGTYDAGSILYVIDENEDFYLVRPFIVSKVDSVWVAKDSTTVYNVEDYERWLYEEERRKFDLE